MNTSEGMKIIEALVKCICDKKLVLNVLDAKPGLSEHSFREIQLIAGDTDLVVMIDDEYGDAKIENPVLWLHLVLDVCEAFEDYPDNYSEWVADMGYRNLPFVESLYQHYIEVVPEIRKIVGSDIHPVHHHDVQFGTSTIKALREYKF